jgi:hypothetical protein
MEAFRTIRVIPFTEYCERVEAHIEDAYGIRVITRDVPDPLTGDLNGAEIHVDYAVTPEQRLFLLAHLFGHTVQWNVNPDAYELGQPRHPPVKEDSLPALMEYEKEAARYALRMLHDIGITDADHITEAHQWLSDYTACDMAYLYHYYRTGEKRNFLSFWQGNTPYVQAQTIPAFTLKKRPLRSDGIVI